MHMTLKEKNDKTRPKNVKEDLCEYTNIPLFWEESTENNIISTLSAWLPTVWETGCPTQPC